MSVRSTAALSSEALEIEVVAIKEENRTKKREATVAKSLGAFCGDRAPRKAKAAGDAALQGLRQVRCASLTRGASGVRRFPPLSLRIGWSGIGLVFIRSVFCPGSPKCAGRFLRLCLPAK